MPPAPMSHRDSRSICRRYCPYIIWSVTLCGIPLLLLLYDPLSQSGNAWTWYFVICFLSIVIENLLWGNLRIQQSSLPNLPHSPSSPVIQAKAPFDIFLRILIVLSASCIALSLLALLISGGGPDIVDGVYCIINHGDWIRDISQTKPLLSFPRRPCLRVSLKNPSESRCKSIRFPSPSYTKTPCQVNRHGVFVLLSIFRSRGRGYSGRTAYHWPPGSRDTECNHR